MDCESAREAISARIDGEDPGPFGDALDQHLTSCADCRAWQQRAHAVTRRVRLGGAFLDRDFAPQVLAAVPPAGARQWQPVVLRSVLAALALAQLAVAAPMLFLGHDHDAGVHAAHELGSFNLALAIAFAVGAVRPRLSAGLAWPCAIAAAGLLATAATDLLSGQAIGTDEALHLVAGAGAAALIWQARTGGATTAQPAAATRTGPDRSAMPSAVASILRRADIPPDPPGGAAARLTAPDVAAAAANGPDGTGLQVRRGAGQDEGAGRDESVA